MVAAVIGGTGVYSISGIETKKLVIETEFGQAVLYQGEGDASDLIFLTRHGVDHDVAPHKINYRANIMALQQLGVKRVIGLFAVGTVNETMPPLDLVALDDFIDFTHSRESTFFDVIDAGVGHVDMSAPFSKMLRDKMVSLAPKHDIKVHDGGVYAGFNGPRFETPAEIRAARLLGCDVVGMTCVPEVILAAEAGLCYAGLAISTNWGAGMVSEIEFANTVDVTAAREKMIGIALEALRLTKDKDCEKVEIL